MTSSFLLAAMALVAALQVPQQAHAGPGHGHATPVATSSAQPRFAAVSETFELVGVLNGKQITLYLDRTADNVPVTDAQIELEIAGIKVKVEKREDAFEVVLDTPPKPGVLPIMATVAAGQVVDLLAGELDLHEQAHSDEVAHVHSWTEYAGWGASALAALIAFIALIVIVRRIAAARQRTSGAFK